MSHGRPGQVSMRLKEIVVLKDPTFSQSASQAILITYIRNPLPKGAMVGKYLQPHYNPNRCQARLWILIYLIDSTKRL